MSPATSHRGAKWKIVRRDAMTSVKQAIRADLAATGMTQADLAAYCGLSEKHVSQVLTGTVCGTFGTLARMAAACGLAITAVRTAPPGSESAQEPPAAPGPHPEMPGPAQALPGGATAAEDYRDEKWRDAMS